MLPLSCLQVLRDASHGRDVHGDGPFGPMRLEGSVPRSQSGLGQDVALWGRISLVILEIAILVYTLILGSGLV